MSQAWSQLETELMRLRRELQSTVNRLWDLKLSLHSSYRNGHCDSDFLPRRLRLVDREETQRLSCLLESLQGVLRYSGELPSPLASSVERETFRNIHRTLRYLKNAYASETSLACHLTRLDRSLPAFARL